MRASQCFFAVDVHQYIAKGLLVGKSEASGMGYFNSGASNFSDAERLTNHPLTPQSSIITYMYIYIYACVFVPISLSLSLFLSGFGRRRTMGWNLLANVTANVTA